MQKEPKCKKSTKTLAVFLASCAIAAAAQAVPMVEWNLNENGSPNGTSYDQSSGILPDASFANVATHLSTTGFALSPSGAPTFPSISGNVFNLTNWNQSAANALDGVDTSQNYVSFLITPEDGYSFSLTGLSISSYTQNTTASIRAPKFGAWGYRVDDGSGFGAWTTTSFQLGLAATVDTAAEMLSLDLPDISTTGTIEIGFWAWGSYGSTPNAVRSASPMVGSVDSGFSPGLIVEGSVSPVPEPSTSLLFGLAGCLAFWRSRRRVAGQA